MYNFYLFLLKQNLLIHPSLPKQHVFANQITFNKLYLLNAGFNGFRLSNVT